MVKKEETTISTKGFLSFQILHELQYNKLCGDDLANIIGNKKGSKLTPGTIYPVLKYLRKKKLVKHRKEGRKKMYSLTYDGAKEYEIVRENFITMFKDILKPTKKSKKKLNLLVKGETKTF